MVDNLPNITDSEHSKRSDDRNCNNFAFPIALDVGTVRIGVARSMLGIVYPLMILERAQSRAEKEILTLLSKENIDGTVVGLPLSADGTENKQCLDVRAFTNRLRKRTSLPIVFQDEYLSSLESNGHDARAAALILQRYITKRW